MPVEVLEISSEEHDRVLSTDEGHFSDVKAIAIAPSKLTRTVAAFANADGGELYVRTSRTRLNLGKVSRRPKRRMDIFRFSSSYSRSVRGSLTHF